MAEATVLVCDRCGQPVADSVILRVGNRNYVTDLCRKHLDDLMRHARVPKRGRKPKSLSSQGQRRASTQGRSRTKAAGKRRKKTAKAAR
jgi:hypothetical protein